MSGQPFILIERVALLTGWNDMQIAALTGLGRSTIQAYRVGRIPEYLDGQQIHNLMKALELWRDQAIQGVAELEALT